MFLLLLLAAIVLGGYLIAVTEHKQGILQNNYKHAE